MKKLIACLMFMILLGMGSNTYAVEFNAKGWYWMTFDYAYGGNFMSKNRYGHNVAGSRMQGSHVPQDEFEALQRVLLKFDAIVNENLYGTVVFKLGNNMWGNAETGGALGTDGTLVRINEAYIDWLVPRTKLRLRMGLQNITLPSFTFENNVLIDINAGITASYKFNDNVALTALWARPYNDNSYNNYVDNIDLFGLVLPIVYDDIKVTPWIMGGIVGNNTIMLKSDEKNVIYTDPKVINTQAAQSWGQVTTGMLPAAFASGKFGHKENYYSDIWWAGLTGKVSNIGDVPLDFMWDMNYGNLNNKKDYLKRNGWLVNGIMEYKLESMTPGIYGWYSSGDDSDITNGSEKMPSLSQMYIGGNTVSSLGFKASPWINNEGILGSNTIGTWGIGARIKDISFIENIKHIVRLNYFGGTNSPKMAKYITGTQTSYNDKPVYRRWTDFNSNYGVYLTEMDTGIEANVDTVFTVYDNLQILLELGYIHLNLNENVWGRYENLKGNTLNYKDAYKVSVGFMYYF